MLMYQMVARCTICKKKIKKGKGQRGDGNMNLESHGDTGPVVSSPGVSVGESSAAKESELSTGFGQDTKLEAGSEAGSEALSNQSATLLHVS